MSIWTDMMIYQYKNLEFCTLDSDSIFCVYEAISIKEDTTASLTEKKIAEFQPKLDGQVKIIEAPYPHSGSSGQVYVTVIIRDSSGTEIARGRSLGGYKNGSIDCDKVTLTIDVKAFETYSISYFSASATNNVTPSDVTFYAYVKPKNYNNFLISKEVD